MSERILNTTTPAGVATPPGRGRLSWSRRGSEYSPVRDVRRDLRAQEQVRAGSPLVSRMHVQAQASTARACSGSSDGSDLCGLRRGVSTSGRAWRHPGTMCSMQEDSTSETDVGSAASQKIWDHRSTVRRDAGRSGWGLCHLRNGQLGGQGSSNRSLSQQWQGSRDLVQLVQSCAWSIPRQSGSSQVSHRVPGGAS